MDARCNQIGNKQKRVKGWERKEKKNIKINRILTKTHYRSYDKREAVLTMAGYLVLNFD